MKILEWGRLRNEDTYFLIFTCAVCRCVYQPQSSVEISTRESDTSPLSIEHSTYCPSCSYENTLTYGKAVKNGPDTSVFRTHERP